MWMDGMLQDNLYSYMSIKTPPKTLKHLNARTPLSKDFSPNLLSYIK